jgi:hypothetical protein
MTSSQPAGNHSSATFLVAVVLAICDTFSLLTASSNTIQSLKSLSRLFIFLTLSPILLKVTVNPLLLLRCHHEEKNQAISRSGGKLGIKEGIASSAIANWEL